MIKNVNDKLSTSSLYPFYGFNSGCIRNFVDKQLKGRKNNNTAVTLLNVSDWFPVNDVLVESDVCCSTEDTSNSSKDAEAHDNHLYEISASYQAVIAVITQVKSEINTNKVRWKGFDASSDGESLDSELSSFFVLEVNVNKLFGLTS